MFYFPIPLCPLGVGFALNRSQLRDSDLPRDRARLILELVYAKYIQQLNGYPVKPPVWEADNLGQPDS